MNEGNVYALIAAVAEEVAKTGIAKARDNIQQNYKFRGIDDVYNALAPILAKHKLVIVPRFLSREITERKSQSGGTLFTVTVEGEFDFISAIDGSKHTARTFGEAMDSGDKATNKAMSAAYKYAAFQAFCIPTEGDNDADATTHDVARAEHQEHGRPIITEDDAIDPHSGVIVTAVRAAKSGTNAKGPWTLYILKFSDGTEAKTFSDTVAKSAREAQQSRRAVAADINNKGELVTLNYVA